MPFRIFLQTRSDGHFLNTEAFSAFEGFSAKGYEVVPLQSLALLPDDATKNDCAFGTVEYVLSYLKRMKVPCPSLLDYPEELSYLLGRRIQQTTIGEIAFTGPIFVKPSRSHKLFTGLVLEKAEDIGLQLSGFPEDTPVYVSPIVDFVSEHRVFVHNSQILDCRRYSGEWSITPSPSIVKEAVSRFASAPIAYSLDFGVTLQGDTLLVEVNDFYALGSYGLESLTYANCIEARWLEITSHK